MVQTSRGCPYACTFCHDGIAYMNKTRAFSAERVREELEYIEARVKTPALQLADLNWGMFPGDIQIARFIADIRRRSPWPRSILTATAKNQKDRMIEMSRILGDLLEVGASIQSTDPEVLRNIKRTNISLDAIVKMAKDATASKTGSFTEIILGLPGDTKEKHVKSVCDMLDAGIQNIRSFQFILLRGTEANDTASRERYAYDTGFRVLARCFGRYDIYDELVPIAEIQEICLGNSTMPRDDYFQCRAYDLTVAIFNNGGILEEFFRLAEFFGIAKSLVIGRIHEAARAPDGPLAPIYEEFRTAEGKNFFEHLDDLEAFLGRPETLDAYLRGEYGVNHIFKARSAALLGHFEELAVLAKEAVAAQLEELGLLDPTLELYLRELLQLSVVRKSDLTDLDRSTELSLHFDFRALHRASYQEDPRRRFVPEGLRFIVRHTEAQKADLRKVLCAIRSDQRGYRAIPSAQRQHPPERGAVPGDSIRRPFHERRPCDGCIDRARLESTDRTTTRSTLARSIEHAVFQFVFFGRRQTKETLRWRVVCLFASAELIGTVSFRARIDSGKRLLPLIPGKRNTRLAVMSTWPFWPSSSRRLFAIRNRHITLGESSRSWAPTWREPTSTFPGSRPFRTPAIILPA